MIEMIAMLNRTEGDLTDDDCDIIARACAVQLDQHFAPAWGYMPWDCQFFEDVRKVPPGAYLHYLLRSAGRANYLGFHDRDPQGNPYIKTFTEATLNGGGTKYNSVDSVSCTASHECLETNLDETAGAYELMPDGILLPSGKVTNGTLTAREACDVCEADGYTIELLNKDDSKVHVWVSDFIYPGYFRPGAPKGTQIDQMQLMTEPFSMRPGGYCILLQGANAWQEFAKEEGPRLARIGDRSFKAHVSARTNRRLVRFTGGKTSP